MGNLEDHFISPIDAAILQHLWEYKRARLRDLILCYYGSIFGKRTQASPAGYNRIGCLVRDRHLLQKSSTSVIQLSQEGRAFLSEHFIVPVSYSEKAPGNLYRALDVSSAALLFERAKIGTTAREVAEDKPCFISQVALRQLAKTPEATRIAGLFSTQGKRYCTYVFGKEGSRVGKALYLDMQTEKTFANHCIWGKAAYHAIYVIENYRTHLEYLIRKQNKKLRTSRPETAADLTGRYFRSVHVLSYEDRKTGQSIIQALRDNCDDIDYLRPLYQERTAELIRQSPLKNIACLDEKSRLVAHTFDGSFCQLYRMIAELKLSADLVGVVHTLESQSRAVRFILEEEGVKDAVLGHYYADDEYWESFEKNRKTPE